MNVQGLVASLYVSGQSWCYCAWHPGK